MTTGQASESTQVLPHDEIYLAEQRIRDDHRYPNDPLYKFWHETADWFNGMASLGRDGQVGFPSNARWREFNRCLAAARDYNAMVERRGGRCPDPLCKGPSRTLTFFPCDAVSVLRELRRSVPDPGVLMAVAQAIING